MMVSSMWLTHGLGCQQCIGYPSHLSSLFHGICLAVTCKPCCPLSPLFLHNASRGNCTVMCSALDAILCIVRHGHLQADSVIILRQACHALLRLDKPSFFHGSEWGRFMRLHKRMMTILSSSAYVHNHALHYNSVPHSLQANLQRRFKRLPVFAREAWLSEGSM